MVGSAFYFFEKVFFWDTLMSHLEKNLDEDPGGAGGVVLVELDHAENPPLNRV